MKVKLEDGYRAKYTLEEYDMAKAVIACEKEDNFSVKEWAESAVREALRNEDGYLEEVLKAEARTAKNSRIDWNRYGDGTGTMDVWISFVAETTEGFIKGGAYLSDIWDTGSTEYKQHMYIRWADWTD